MLTTFGELSRNISFRPKWRTIDNVVFKLHYRLTFLLLVGATVLVCSRQYIGEHIRCVTDLSSYVQVAVVETFCFFSSTYTVVRHLQPGAGAGGALHPGVGPAAEHEPVLRHAYYQWVPFMLFGQALLFYLPHLVWRKMEAGRVYRLSEALQGLVLATDDAPVQVSSALTVPSRQERAARLRLVRASFLDRLPLYRCWACGLVLCEVLNLANAVGQIFLTDVFLGGRFLSLGPALLRPGPDDAPGPLDVVFPKMTKCTFHKYGPSGSVQNFDALCVMALNIINEKIYAFLWFWLPVLAAASALAVLWRALSFVLHRHSRRFNVALFRSSCPGPVNERALEVVSGSLGFSNWLFLYYLGSNMHGLVFRELLEGLAEELQGKAQPSPPQRRVDTLAALGSERESLLLDARVVCDKLPSAPHPST